MKEPQRSPSSDVDSTWHHAEPAPADPAERALRLAGSRTWLAIDGRAAILSPEDEDEDWDEDEEEEEEDDADFEEEDEDLEDEDDDDWEYDWDNEQEDEEGGDDEEEW